MGHLSRYRPNGIDRGKFSQMDCHARIALRNNPSTPIRLFKIFSQETLSTRLVGVYGIYSRRLDEQNTLHKLAHLPTNILYNMFRFLFFFFSSLSDRALPAIYD